MRSKNYISFLFFCIISSAAIAQGRLVMDNDVYLNISNGAYVVLANGNSNALTQTGTGGRIITESETNRLRWMIGNNTGSYVMPYFDDDNALEIPFTVAIGTAGSAGGQIDFSTYDNASWDNNTYRPSDVLNMASYVGGANNSPKVIDRFWIADASSYGTKPSATFTFSYIDAEWMAAGNSIAEANLGAQRFDNVGGNWDAYVPQGTVNTVANTVTAVPVVPADFFRSWTLVDRTSPLPIELLSFEGNCSENTVKLKWVTATETNNDYFRVERSEDGLLYHAIATIDGAGNSVTNINYSFTDLNAFSSGAYYRLKQTDYNGAYQISPAIYIAGCSSSDIDIYSSGGDEFTVVAHTLVAGNYTISVFSALGQIVSTKIIYLTEGFSQTTFQVENLNNSVYFININNGINQSLTRKIVIN